MASRKEDTFFSNEAQGIFEKENQNPSVPGAAAASAHKPLSRRATCPNMSTGLVCLLPAKNINLISIFLLLYKENPVHQNQAGGFISGLRKPLSTLNALNRNLQKIFKRSSSAKESEEKSESTSILEVAKKPFISFSYNLICGS